MNYQWYPGHMTKAKRMMQENIKLIDLIIELVDARTPLASRNPDIDELGKNKFRLILLNKSDLADPKCNAQWMEYFKEKGGISTPTILIISNNKIDARLEGLYTTSDYIQFFKENSIIK